jgi:hypothetical protein
VAHHLVGVDDAARGDTEVDTGGASHRADPATLLLAM